MTERDETRDRFLAAIAERIPAEQVVEMHVFPPIKQGGTESGVAVVAVAERPAVAADTEVPIESEVHDPADEQAEGDPGVDRLGVYTARYRLTQKGPDRGRWEFALSAEADAPLVTVDKVVQGVQRRSGDAEDPQRLTGEEFRERLPKPASPPPSAEARAQPPV